MFGASLSSALIKAAGSTAAHSVGLVPKPSTGEEDAQCGANCLLTLAPCSTRRRPSNLLRRPSSRHHQEGHGAQGRVTRRAEAQRRTAQPLTAPSTVAGSQLARAEGSVNPRETRGQDKRRRHHVGPSSEIVFVCTLFRWRKSGTRFFDPLSRDIVQGFVLAAFVAALLRENRAFG